MQRWIKLVSRPGFQILAFVTGLIGLNWPFLTVFEKVTPSNFFALYLIWLVLIGLLVVTARGIRATLKESEFAQQKGEGEEAGARGLSDSSIGSEEAWLAPFSARLKANQLQTSHPIAPKRRPRRREE